jgi:hypothetical protein
MATPAVTSLKGTGYQQITHPRFSPQVTQQLESLLGGGLGGLGSLLQRLSGLAGGGDEETWKQLEAPALRQFGQLQGGLASRFSGMGSGARRSSGFQNTVSGAGADLAERLQGNRLNLQNQAGSQLAQLVQMLLGGSDQETSLVPKQKPFWQELLGSLGGGIGQGIGSFGTLAGGKQFGLF